MNSFIERKVRALLDKVESISANGKSPAKDKRECESLIDQVDHLLSARINTFPTDFSLETMVRIPETILNFPAKRAMAEKYLKVFLRNVDSEGLYNVKVHLLYAQMLSQKANEEYFESAIKVQFVRDAVLHLSHAIKTVTQQSSHKRYSSMAYNVSKAIYQMVRMFFRPGHLQEFTEIVKAVRGALVTQVEEEYDWNGFFSWLLFYCLEDSKASKAESVQVLEKLWESSKQTNYFFHEDIFRLRVAYSAGNPQAWQALAKEADKDPSGELRVTLALQSIRSRITPENQVEKELNSLTRYLMPNRADNSPANDSSSVTDSLCEIAHLAAVNAIPSLAHTILERLKKKQQVSSKAYILIEFTKAEMALRSKPDEAALNKEQSEAEQMMLFDIRCRLEALHLITKAIKAKLVFLNPLYLYEGCVKIWNISLPFLNERHKTEVTKSFGVAAKVLEEIQSSDFHLRICLHFELAKVKLEKDSVHEAEEHARKCNRLLNFFEGYFDQKKVEELLDKIDSVLRPLEAGPRTLMDLVQDKMTAIASGAVEDVESAFGELRILMADFKTDDLGTVEAFVSFDSVDCKEQLKHMSDDQKTLYRIRLFRKACYKALLKKSSLYEECCRLAFDKNMLDCCLALSNQLIAELNELSQLSKASAADAPNQTPQTDPSSITISDVRFDPETDQSIQIHLVKLLFLKSQSTIKKLTDEGVEFALEEVVATNPDQTIPLDRHEAYNAMKTDIIACFIKAVQIAFNLKQTWLVFNAGVLIWNTYLLPFRSVQTKKALHSMTIDLLDTYFNALKSAISVIEQRKIVDYDFENKVQVYGNISIIFTRMLEQRGDYSKAYSITEDLLLVSLSPQTRKIVNSIRSRVGVLLKPDKTGKKQTASLANQTDQTVFEINSKLEIIANNFSGNLKQEDRLQAIRDCYDLLVDFHEKKVDNIDRELLAELWTKLANLALNEEKTECTKLALSALEKVLEKPGADVKASSSKYIAVAKFLYAKALCHLVAVSGIVKEQHEMILMKSLQLLLESIDTCIKNRNNKIFEQTKQFYLIIKVISEQLYTPENRRCIIKPIFSLVYYIKMAKEMFEGFTKDIELSQILVNMSIFVTRGCLVREDWELALTVSNLVLEICHASLKDRVWVLKVIALTKKGGDVQSVFEEIKNCNVGLQCTLLQEIAWNAESVQQQYQAFSRAIDIVKKENSPRVFEVILNFKEWMFRNDFPIENIRESLSFLERIVHRKSFESSQPPTVQTHSKSNNENVPPSTQVPSIGRLSSHSKDSFAEPRNAREEDAVDHFSSIKSSLESSKSLFGWVNYSVEDCDNLFKVYVISSMLVQSLKERMALVGSAVFFLWKTFHVVFGQIHQSSKESAEDSAEVVMATMPQTSTQWIELQLPQSFLDGISRSDSKLKFCKKAFKQPLVTFHYLLTLTECIRDFGSPVQMVILVKFIGLFASRILENELASHLSTLLTAQFYHFTGHPQPADTALKAFLESVPLTQEYFSFEIDGFAKTYSDAFSKNFELNPITSKTKRTQFLNVFYPFEFWVMFAEVFLSLNQHHLVKVIVPNAMVCCTKASASELLGKCQVMLATVLSRDGESKQARLLFESAGKHLKLLKHWKVFLSSATTHFIAHKDLTNPWKVVENFETLISSLLPKDNFKYNRFFGKDILAFLQLVKVNLHIEEFLLFERNLVIESEDFYCNNVVKLLSEALGLIQNFIAMSDGGLLPSNFEYLLLVLGKVVQLMSRVKLLNYDFMNQAYIHCSLLLVLFEKLEGHWAEVRHFIVDGALTQQPQAVANSAASGGSDSSAEELYGRRLSELSFLHTRTANAFLKIELIYRNNNFAFPAVKEKHSVEKHFGSFRKLKLVEAFESSKDNIIDDYVDVFEYKLHQNIRRSWALLAHNLSQIERLKSTGWQWSEAFNLMVDLELQKTLRVRQEYQTELATMKKGKLVEGAKSGQRESSNTTDNNDASHALTVPADHLPQSPAEFHLFMSADFFNFSVDQQLQLLESKNQSSSESQVRHLIQYQGFLAQRTMFEFYFDKLDKSNSTGKHFRDVLTRKDSVELKALIDTSPELKMLFNQRLLDHNLSVLPRNSFYVIMEPMPDFSRMAFGVVYLGDDDSSNHFVFASPANSSQTVVAIKNYLRSYELMHSEFKGEIGGQQKVLAKVQKELSLVIHSLVEFLTEFDTAVKSVAQRRAKEMSGKPKTADKRRGGDGAVCKFNGLFFLASAEFVQMPFELVFEQWRDDFSFFASDLSMHNLICKSVSPNGSKPAVIFSTECFFLASDGQKRSESVEAAAVSQCLSQIASEGFDFDNGHIPDVPEVQRKIQKKRGLVVKSCHSFDSLLNYNDALAVASTSKLEVLVCLDNIRPSKPDSIGRDHMQQSGCNFIQKRHLLLLTSFLNIRACVLSKGFLTTASARVLLESLVKRSESDGDLSCLLESEETRADFCLFGNPLLAFQSQGKPKGK
jgi:hypothetical protein